MFLNLIQDLNDRLKLMEGRFAEMGYSMKQVVQSEFKKKFKIDLQSETQYGMHTAFVVDTVDPWKQNRVRFFSPLFHDPKTTIKALPWAHPISAMGGFDDSGLTWVPPAGSTICLIFENGYRSSPYYLGTIWNRNRGTTSGNRDFNYNIQEFYQIWEGHRKGFLLGPDDGSQVLPPWNTENYNGSDINAITDATSSSDAQKNITYPNIFGFKTPEKHMLKMVDGDPKCNRRWKRIELLSSCGNWMIFKDDHLHYAGQWAHPSCGAKGAPVSGCHGDVSDTANDFGPVENTACQGPNSNSTIMGGHPSTPTGTQFANSQTGSNPYFKNQNECRPYQGPGTPMNPTADLPQSGIQIMSVSGHTWVMDDSVEEPSGTPMWERSLQPFDFGCNNKFLGSTYWQSATGHTIEMSDVEEDTKLRGQNNYIRALTASGNLFEMNDHTIGQANSGCPSNVAGDQRGITLQSTSGNMILMRDQGTPQCSPPRTNGGTPLSQAKQAYIMIRTGYGLQMEFQDQQDQTKTDQQFIAITAPQISNKQRNGHYMRFQEKASGPGQILLRAGGDYIISTYDNMVETVGVPNENPSDKIVEVTRKYVISVNDLYFNKAKTHIYYADNYILLFAGNDCPPPTQDANAKPGPCLYPVVVAKCPTRCPIFPWMVHYMEDCRSNRVFASADDKCGPNANQGNETITT